MSLRGNGVFLLLLCVVLPGCPAPPEAVVESWRGTTYADPPPVAEDFTLHDQHGRPFRLADHQGRVVLLFFGYVHCPDVCPVTLSTWAKVQTALEDVRDRVEFVFVTVDPERDTPERLKQHLEVFGRDIYGLTGSEAELSGVYEHYGIFQEKIPISTSAGGYVVDHSTRMLLIDAQGHLRLRYAFDVHPDDIVHDMRRLLGEAPPARSQLGARDAWARPTIAAGAEDAPLPEAPGVVYVTVDNRGDRADRLVGAETDVARIVEIHETRVQGDRMRMVQLEDGAEVPAHGALELRPGGVHLMLIDLKRHLRPGETFRLRLRFASAPEQSIDVGVRDP